MEKGGEYVGNFRKGRASGKGKYAFSEGRVYIGEFKNFQFYGKGILTYLDGSIKEGIWKSGDFQYAKKIYPSIPTAKTPAQDDEIIPLSGLPPCPSSEVFHYCFGAYTYRSGNEYVGEWKDDKRHGLGISTDADGTKYAGEHKDGIATKGTRTLVNGNKYISEFKGCQKHGQGTYIFADGTVEEGIWKDGYFVEE